MSIETKHGLIFDISENIILKNLLGMAGTRISFRNPGVCGLYCFEDDSGLYDGTGMTCDGAEITPSGFIFRWHSECFSLESEFSYDFDSKVWSRCDSVTNITDKVQTIYSCLSRFVLESAAVEVYTQSSVWNHENQGVWAPLVTSVTAENHGLRTTEGSTPIAAVRQKGQNGGVVFHLFPMGKWKINVSKRIGTSGSMHTVIDMGLSDEKLKLKVAPGEKLQLPEIVFFRFNDEALDAHKLHRYLIKNKLSTNIPPVIYNSWFLDFDVLDFEYFRAQVDVASKLGIEVFTVDAGWFGDGVHWTRSVGDWEENQVGAFGGRMRELAEYVRSKGIKFGLWMEPERATPHSKLYNKNPDLFFLSDSGD
ncbi:MAG: hypothetical protein GX633_01020, partial [Clostridiales bacterium]|nr:hypothetical protein [Clostridiales bacterium]